MKKVLMFCTAALLAASCNNQPAPQEVKETTPAAPPEEKVDYAYLPANHPPDNWDRGSQKNVALVLKTLKTFAGGNVEESMKDFGDSVYFSADGVDAKFSKDSLTAMFKQEWKNIGGIKIEMYDYESVISKDKKEEWVTLWYKQLTTDKKGKVDSVSVVDDLKIENGKITVLDEKSRRFPVKK